MIILARTFGDTVKLLRKERNLTQGELGELLGLSPSAVGSYERGIREPAYNNLIDLAKALGVSVDYLIGATDERMTVERFLSQERYDLKDVLDKFIITIHEHTMSAEEKRRIYDVAVGLLWSKFSES